MSGKYQCYILCICINLSVTSLSAAAGGGGGGAIGGAGTSLPDRLIRPSVSTIASNA